MSNTFLFIIPLTPVSHLSPTRQFLRTLCLNNLANQTYGAWRALLIGKTNDADPKNENFLFLDFEGHKEEKLQKAIDYIFENNILCDYIIRLDDDDLFNPNILSELKDREFDLCVDKHHSFWSVFSGQVAQKVMYWFPNTCIHKRQHALNLFGTFPPGDYVRYKTQPVLIENEHNDFHHYYTQNHHIIYTRKSNPLYLRSLSATSITSAQAVNYGSYLNQHGYWRKNTLPAFLFLNNSLTNVSKHSIAAKQGLLVFIKNWVSDYRAIKNYTQVVILKKK